MDPANPVFVLGFEPHNAPEFIFWDIQRFDLRIGQIQNRATALVVSGGFLDDESVWLVSRILWVSVFGCGHVLQSLKRYIREAGRFLWGLLRTPFLCFPNLSTLQDAHEILVRGVFIRGLGVFGEVDQIRGQVWPGIELKFIKGW